MEIPLVLLNSNIGVLIGWHHFSCWVLPSIFMHLNGTLLGTWKVMQRTSDLYGTDTPQIGIRNHNPYFDSFWVPQLAHDLE